MRNVFIAIGFLSIVLCSCYNDKADKLYPQANNINQQCDTSGTITYSGSVQPILTTNCAISGCHDATTAANGYAFTDYNNTIKAVHDNKLLGSINHETGYIPMPENNSKISPCNINIITKWVNEGTPDN